MDIDAFIESILKTKQPPKFPPSMYYTEGTKYLNLCHYSKALEFLDNAVIYEPKNMRYLLKRSKCLIALREYKKAIEDANKVLKLCPGLVGAIDLKGQAQYLMGDFEGGYLTYLEGRKHRPVNNDLRLGKQRCKEALDNSMDPSQTVKLNKDDVASKVSTKRDDAKFETTLKYRRSSQECFGKDKKFMEELMKDKNLSNCHSFCKEAVDFIKDCERFWAAASPLSTRRKAPKISNEKNQNQKLLSECQ